MDSSPALERLGGLSFVSDLQDFNLKAQVLSSAYSQKTLVKTPAWAGILTGSGSPG